VLIEKDDNLMWLKLLKGKYPVDIISSKPMWGSPFRYSTHKIKELFS
jgi:hypothetical protein